MRMCERCEGAGQTVWDVLVFFWSYLTGGVGRYCKRCNGTGIEPTATHEATT